MQHTTEELRLIHLNRFLFILGVILSAILTIFISSILARFGLGPIFNSIVLTICTFLFFRCHIFSATDELLYFVDKEYGNPVINFNAKEENVMKNFFIATFIVFPYVKHDVLYIRWILTGKNYKHNKFTSESLD